MLTQSGYSAPIDTLNRRTETPSPIFLSEGTAIIVAEGVQRRLLTAVLAADVAGYSRLIGEDEVGTRARFNAHFNELIEPTIASHRGSIVKTTGDGANDAARLEGRCDFGKLS